jgi:hypothetical protein
MKPPTKYCGACEHLPKDAMEQPCKDCEWQSKWEPRKMFEVTAVARCPSRHQAEELERDFKKVHFDVTTTIKEAT